MSDITTYYQINREIISNRAKEYYKNYKEVLREQARLKYRELIDEKKIKRESMEEIGVTICQKQINKN